MFRLIACAAAAGLFLAACAEVPPAAPGVVEIRVSPQPGEGIPPDFIGLSYEKASLSLPLFDPSDTGLVRLLRRLGPGVLRVGGNSVDRTLWDPTGPGLRKGLVAPADISRLARFLEAAGWSIIYGLPMASGDPATIADEASAASQAFGHRLAAFEIGNEPDLYHGNGLRTYADYLREWKADAEAISRRLPNAVFSGPAAADDLQGYTVPFSRDARGLISLLTQHYYRGNGRLPTATVGLLLSPDPRLSALLGTLAATSRQQGIPFRLAEANSFYGGGAPHVSDSFASALWALNFLFQCAAAGAAGVNFHSGGEAPGYTPIADTGERVSEVRPEYYGIYLFSLASNGNLIPALESRDDPSLSAWAVHGRDDSLRVVLLNRSDSKPLDVELQVPASLRTASLLRLTGPSLEAESGTLLGGAPIRADGSWRRKPEKYATVKDGRLPVEVAAASALLAVFH